MFRKLVLCAALLAPTSVFAGIGWGGNSAYRYTPRRYTQPVYQPRYYSTPYLFDCGPRTTTVYGPGYYGVYRQSGRNGTYFDNEGNTLFFYNSQ